MPLSIAKEISVSDMQAMRDSGMNQKQIASSLQISTATVRKYLGLVHHSRKTVKKATVINDNPSTQEQTFGDKCQAELDRQAGKASVQFEILSSIQTFKGNDCTYKVDGLAHTVEIVDGLVLGSVDAKQLDQFIAELQVIRGKLAC